MSECVSMALHGTQGDYLFLNDPKPVPEEDRTFAGLADFVGFAGAAGLAGRFIKISSSDSMRDARLLDSKLAAIEGILPGIFASRDITPMGVSRPTG